MNYIWGGMIVISVITSIITGRVDETVNAVFDGASTAVATLISFAGAMCFWTGIMKVSEKSGVSSVIRRIISPVVNRLFPDSSDKAREYISMNINANILGMGNAATPSGIEAMHELDKINKTPEKPSPEMCIFTVLNTCSIGLIPTTIISLRASAGSENPASVVLPIWISSLLSLLFALIAVKLLQRSRK